MKGDDTKKLGDRQTYDGGDNGDDDSNSTPRFVSQIY